MIEIPTILLGAIAAASAIAVATSLPGVLRERRAHLALKRFNEAVMRFSSTLVTVGAAAQEAARQMKTLSQSVPLSFADTNETGRIAWDGRDY